VVAAAPRSCRCRDMASSKMDVNLMDEPAGKARMQKAAEAKERRAREKAELARKNAEMKKRLQVHQNTTRTDDNLDDEEAGRKRAELAKLSKERRAKEEAALDAANDKIFQSLRNTTVKTDDDIMDEEAGRYMVELAAASAVRRQAEKADLAAKNKAAASRLAMVKPQVTITSKEGLEEDVKGYLVEPFKFVAQQVDPYAMVRQPGDPPAPSWLGKHEKYLW